MSGNYSNGGNYKQRLESRIKIIMTAMLYDMTGK